MNSRDSSGQGTTSGGGGGDSSRGRGGLGGGAGLGAGAGGGRPNRPPEPQGLVGVLLNSLFNLGGKLLRGDVAGAAKGVGLGDPPSLLYYITPYRSYIT